MWTIFILKQNCLLHQLSEKKKLQCDYKLNNTRQMHQFLGEIDKDNCVGSERHFNTNRLYMCTKTRCVSRTVQLE